MEGNKFEYLHKSKISADNISTFKQLLEKSGLNKQDILNFLLEIYKNLEENLPAPTLFLLLKDPHLFQLQVINDNYQNQNDNSDNKGVSYGQFQLLLDKLEKMESKVDELQKKDDYKVSKNIKQVDEIEEKTSNPYGFSEEEIKQLKANKVYRG